MGSGSRISVRSFRGAQRFIYFDRLGREHSIYSKTMPQKLSIPSLLVSLFMLALFAYAGYLMTDGTIHAILPHKPLKPVYAQNGVHISDNADVIDNEAELERILNAFEDDTGICPYVMTVFDTDWNKTSSTLDGYAYSKYIRLFDDEQHFLVVYSQPKNTQDRNDVDWSWEAIQGDDTDPILTKQAFQKFRDKLHGNLSNRNCSVGEAFALSFGTDWDVMRPLLPLRERIVLAGVVLLWDAYTLYSLISSIRGFVYSRKKYHKAPTNEEGSE